MNGIVIDTNIYSASARGDDRVAAIMRRASRLYIPFITIAELRVGFALGSKGHINEKYLQRTLAADRVSVLFANDTTTLYYARIYAQIRAKGTPIPTNDLWIAALTMQHGLPLFTRDEHFKHVESIALIS